MQVFPKLFFCFLFQLCSLRRAHEALFKYCLAIVYSEEKWQNISTSKTTLILDCFHLGKHSFQHFNCQAITHCLIFLLFLFFSDFFFPEHLYMSHLPIIYICSLNHIAFIKHCCSLFFLKSIIIVSMCFILTSSC